MVVGTDDAVGLARAITALLDDPEALDRAARNSRALGEEATFDAMVDSYAELVRA